MANEAAGRDFLLKLELVLDSGTYTTVGGLRAKTGTWNHEGIEVTNHGSNEWKEMLNSAGIRSMAISGSGIFNRDSTQNKVEDNIKAGTQMRAQLIDIGASGRTIQGLFHISSFEKTGEYNGAVEYSMSLESSGEVTAA